MSGSTVGIVLRNVQVIFSLHKFMNVEVKNVIGTSRNTLMHTIH